MKRKLQNRSKTHTRITHGYRIDGRLVRTLRYNVGTCPDASSDNPHNIGEKPDTCDRCYIVQ